MRCIAVNICLCLLLSVNPSWSEIIEPEFSADVASYCKYIAEKNKAKREVLLAPDVIVRAQNTNNSYPYQNNLISALSKDVVDYNKARQIKRLIHQECDYYRLNQAARLQIKYAIPQVQRQALVLKLKSIQQAKEELSRNLHSVKDKVEHQHDTLPHYYHLESLVQKLDDAAREIRINLAMEQYPRLNPMPLNDLLQQLWVAEKKRQATRNALAKQYNWSLQLQAGAQQSLSYNRNQNVEPYLALFLRYNLGSIASSHTVDNSLEHFMDWKNKQVNGIQQQLQSLSYSVTALKTEEQNRLNHLLQHYKKYYGLRQQLGGVDSIKARHFKQQIEVDRLMMDIEIRYLQSLIGLLGDIK